MVEILMRQDLIEIDNNLTLIPLVTPEQLIDNADIALFDIVCKDTPNKTFLVLRMMHLFFNKNTV